MASPTTSTRALPEARRSLRPHFHFPACAFIFMPDCPHFIRDFVADRAQGRQRVRRARDRPADDQVVRAVGDRLARRRDALLVILRRVRGPYAGRHQHEALAALPAQRRRFLRRAHHAVEPARLREVARAAARHPAGCRPARPRAMSAAPMLVSSVTAISLGALRALASASRAALHHGAPAERVHVDHPHAQPRRRRASRRDRVRDVVKLQVEKDGESGFMQYFQRAADPRRCRAPCRP